MRNIFALVAILLFGFAIAAQAQIITTITGNDSSSYCCDGGPAVDAGIHDPSDIAVDGAGNVYIADCLNQRIRKINTSGIITTIAGTGLAGFNWDDVATTIAEGMSGNKCECEDAASGSVLCYFAWGEW